MDIKIALSCVLIAGGGLGIALPFIGAEDRLDRVYERPPQWAAAQAPAPAQARLAAVQQTPANWLEEQVVLNRENDGHFYANVTVDGQSYRMLVDTGASVVALTAGDAAAMGLYWDPADIAPIAQGAGGAVEGVNTSITRMRVGEHEASGVRAMIIPNGLGISLLGQSFLSSLSKVEITGDRMVLGN